MNSIKERANAKINLYLDCISKNDNGFHDIKTVMHSLDLFDVITVSKEMSKTREISLYLKGNRRLPVDSKNLAYRSAELFMEKANLFAKVKIVLDKHIPIAAGLAGGSSDAAAVLRAMNKLFDRPFTVKMLEKIAAELGSDVPYCLYGKTALCEGRGEIITKLPDNLSLNCVIAISNERVSTPLAYSELDSRFSNFDGTVRSDFEDNYSKLIKSIYEGKLDCNSLYNIFETVVLPKCEGALKIKEKMVLYGANATLMSGSGPSVYGVFKDSSDAQIACQKLRSDGFIAFSCKST